MFEVVSDGGLIPVASDNTMNMFVPHLLFGYAWMNFFSYLSCDLALLRGKVGCRPGAFLLYYPCRYLSLVSMISLLAYYDSFQKVELEVLTYISQATSALSLGFALSILAVRVCTLYKNKYLSLFMQLTAVALWGIILRNMEDVNQPGVPHSHVVSHVTMAVMMAGIPTSTLMLTLFYVLVVAKHEHDFRVRDCLQMMWNVDVAELALICIIAIPSTVLYILDISDSASCHLAMGYASFVTTTITAARIYRKMLHRLDSCPVNLCPIQVYRWLEQGALFVAGKLGLKSRSCPIASNQAHPSSELPPLGSQRATQSLTLSMLSARRRQAADNRICVPAHSRSTYAHSSLYDSQAS
ncbi:hypothetical protein V8D89_008387 [Ganoderma adspersum]